MSRRERAAALSHLTAMVRDARLQELRQVAQERRDLLDELRKLDAPASGHGKDRGWEFLHATVHARYQIWSDARRAEVNIRLAACTARWLDARAAAARAVGRHGALTRLTRQCDARAMRKRQQARETGAH